EARRSVLDLRAAPLEGRTLGEALSALAEDFAARTGLPIRSDAAGGSRPLPARVEAGLSPIAQGAPAHTLTHADARSATIRLETTPEKVQLTITDDGRGFDPSQVSRDRFGLIGLSERVRLLGGRLRLRSSPGKGTQIKVVIPLGADR